MYRGVDVVMNVFQPLLSKHGVFVVPEVLNTTREERQTKSGGNLIYTVIKVKYTFYADDGSSICAIVQGEGMDSADKSSNKAMSVAFKYACFQVFCIPTEEMKDPDADTPPPSEPSEKRLICVKCGHEITARERGGKTYSADTIAKNSVKKYGKTVCWDCMEKMKHDSQN